MNNSERLLLLMKKVQEGIAEPPDYRELRQLIDTDESGEIARQVHAFHDAQLGPPHHYDRDYWQDAIKEILQVDKQVEVDQESEAIPVKRLVVSGQNRWWWWAAAFVLLVAVGGGYLWRNSKEASGLVAEKNVADDVLPGKQGAILTLADGTQMVLDSLSNGMIAKQGNTAITLNDNQLQYAYTPDVRGETAVMYNVVRTPKGRQFKLSLPDGTKVWLNAFSTIRYPAVFMGRERNVEITGEAYFEVAQNKKMPFIVKINDTATVEVLGTHFNINAYEDEAAIRTTLLEGSVKMSGGGYTRLMAAGQQATLQANGITLVQNADAQAAIAWKNGLFSFTDADLPTVMRQLARWYDVDVAYEGSIPRMEFNGKIDNSLTLSQLLKGLAKTKIKYRIEEGKKIVIQP